MKNLIHHYLISPILRRSGFLLLRTVTLVQDFRNLVGRELLAAAGGNDGALGNGADGGIVKGDAHFGESGGQTYFADEVGKEVNALVGILHQPDFLRPTAEFLFCALVDVAIDDGVQYGKPLTVVAISVGFERMEARHSPISSPPPLGVGVVLSVLRASASKPSATRNGIMGTGF